MVVGLNPIVVTKTSDFVPALRKEFLDIQATIECGFTLKGICDRRIYSYVDHLQNSQQKIEAQIYFNITFLTNFILNESVSLKLFISLN